MRTERTTEGSAGERRRLEPLVERAVSGERPALEELVREIQGDVYNLAVRMLWCPEDAADASQEILMKVVTRLSTFRGESAFRTWVYRVATNHLLNVQKSRVEREEPTFSRLGEQLAVGLSDPPAPAAHEPDQALLEEEVKIGCTQAMLLCLDREHRIAYILGEVFELSSDEAAAVLEVSPAAYRKRLSRARERLRTFMRGHCGLLNPEFRCRCARRIRHATEAGIVRPEALLFAGKGVQRARGPAVAAEVAEMEEMHQVAALFRSHPDYAAPERLLAGIRGTLEADRYVLLR